MIWAVSFLGLCIGLVLFLLLYHALNLDTYSNVPAARNPIPPPPCNNSEEYINNVEDLYDEYLKDPFINDVEDFYK